MGKKGKYCKKNSFPWRRSLGILLTLALVFLGLGYVFVTQVSADRISGEAEQIVATEIGLPVESAPAETMPTAIKTSMEDAAAPAESNSPELLINTEEPGLVSVYASGQRDESQQVMDFVAGKGMQQEPEETVPKDDFRWISVDDLDMLLRIAMAEVGGEQCKECAALVMCVVINRVRTPGFSSNIYYVLHTPDQFTPVEEGTFETAVPNSICKDALRMVLDGWDESQGALYFECCTGPSWHSENKELLFQHCNTRFYK